MRLLKGFKVSAPVAMAVPALLVLTAITTFADASPARTPLPGDPNKGGTLYGQNCATCHGVNLEGNIGPALNPIFKLPGVTDPLDPDFLIQIITNGRKHQAGDPGTVDMPAKGGNANLTPQDVRDLAAYIIQLKQLDPTCVVTVADPLITQGPEVVRRLASLYSPLIQRSRVAWGAVYHSSNTKPTFAAIRAVFGRGVRNAISELLQQHDPDVVLSVHPLLNHVAHQAIQKGGRPRALMTVITDLVDFHRGWTFSQADLVVAPTELARKVALRRRVPADRVKLLGLPVDLRSRPPAPGEKLTLRRRFGLDETRFTVLVMGGAAGVGNLLKQVRVLAWEPHQWQGVAVCGRNEKLRPPLARVRFAAPTRL